MTKHTTSDRKFLSSGSEQTGRCCSSASDHKMRSSGFAGMNRFDKFTSNEISILHQNCSDKKLCNEMLDLLKDRADSPRIRIDNSDTSCPECGEKSVEKIYSSFSPESMKAYLEDGNVVGAGRPSSSCGHVYGYRHAGDDRGQERRFCKHCQKEFFVGDNKCLKRWGDYWLDPNDPDFNRDSYERTKSYHEELLTAEESDEH